MTKTDIMGMIAGRLFSGMGALVVAVTVTFICSVVMRIQLEQWQQMVIVSVVSFYVGNQKSKADNTLPPEGKPQ
jgi:ABC-type phosphate transport system permease subunit